MDRRCPDCDATMAKTTPVTAMQQERMKLRTEERRSGVLGSLGVTRKLPVNAFVCPKCGLVRWYADLDEE